jgi:hypothetical protein
VLFLEVVFELFVMILRISIHGSFMVRRYLESNQYVDTIVSWNLIQSSGVSRVLDKTRSVQEITMDFPLIIAILALLAWTLLPQLDRYMESDPNVESSTSILSRLAHWVNN